ncbi:heavy metal-associated domain-containing protein [Longispora sp. NPDC051575]|uniref:heavy-metal-associated domain-containing protein n=1 Tax=Longispora sp. NPDC051575 TaxID=3154943 RepID=UPI00343F2E95
MCASEPTTAQIESCAVVGQTFTVAGMSCQPCATRVTTAVEAVDGVTGATVDLAARLLTVSGTATTAEIHAAVTHAGYQVVTS